VDALPTIIAAGALILSAAVYLLTRGARRRADPGDFEQRLEDLRKGRGLAGSSGAARGHAALPVPGLGEADKYDETHKYEEHDEDEDEDDDEAQGTLPPPPTLEEYAAPPGPARVYTDPELGEFSYDAEDETWRQVNEGADVPYYYIEAGPDGPNEVQRRCLAAFIDDEETILDRAFEGLFATIELRGLERPVMEVASVYVDAWTPDPASACGRIFFRFDGYQGLPASVSTTDDWTSLHCDVEARPQPAE
jgi:hypothetical protein